MPPLKDEQIVALYWERNEDAIRYTSQKYGAYLTRISYNILSDLQDCEECVNDTYWKAWNSMPTHRPSLLPCYLGKIVRQGSIDVFRKKHTRKRYASEYTLSLAELGDSFSDGSTPEQELDAMALREAVNTFLHTLQEDARNAFIGRYFYFDSVKQVAAYCGLSEAAAKSMLYRTRQALKEYLIKEGFEP